jgi:tRNA U34 2-thiouridine synthase MnmA/TrmU
VATHRLDEERIRALLEPVPPRFDEEGRRVRCVALYSGGLDSTLAALLMRLQGVDVVAVNMFTGFCTTDHQRRVGRTDRDGGPKEHEALGGAAALDLPIEVVDVRAGYLQVLTRPRFGWGSAVNPCIDCRIHMLGKAGRELLREHGAHFVVTGEVLGQRPMTQMRQKLRLIEEEAGLSRLIVRPLSQGLLWRTIPEERGWIDGSRLLRISGRGRKPQIALAQELGLLRYPQPAGGCCFLTDGNYGKRLRDLLDHRDPDSVGFEDVLALKGGRHFRLPGGQKLVLGRNEKENEWMLGFWMLGPFLQVRELNGPLGLYLGDRDSPDFALAKRVLARYADTGGAARVVVEELRQDEVVDAVEVEPLPKGDERAWLIV